jgi:hypothetical protein
LIINIALKSINALSTKASILNLKLLFYLLTGTAIIIVIFLISNFKKNNNFLFHVDLASSKSSFIKIFLIVEIIIET